MRILLAHSNMLANDRKQTEKMLPYPPLATLYAAGSLQALGHEVVLFDGIFDPDLARFDALVAQHRPEIFVLLEDIYNFLSKMCLGHQRSTGQRMCARAKAAGAHVIVGGPDASDAPKVYLESGADYVVLGEPDATIDELVKALCHSARPEVGGIAGLAYAGADGGVLLTGARANKRELDGVAFPAWSLVDAEAYRSAWRAKHGFFSVNMVGSRGCTYACNWCAKPIWGRSYAQRSARNLAEELAVVRQHLAPEHLWFCDDIFGITPRWLRDFDAAVHALGVVTPYKIQTRANLITDETAALLKHSGCAEVWIGAESGSQMILDAMDKGTTLAEIADARHALGRAGVRTGFFLQFGYPGETFTEIQQTVAMVRELVPDDVGISVSYPLPGTKFYERVRAQMGDKTHWEHSHDLSVMHAGEYDSAFYHRLHTLVHEELRLCLRERGLQDTGTGLPVAPGQGLAAERAALAADWAALGEPESLARHSHPSRLAAMATP